VYYALLATPHVPKWDISEYNNINLP
jgi:hypothetical protein